VQRRFRRRGQTEPAILEVPAAFVSSSPIATSVRRLPSRTHTNRTGTGPRMPDLGKIARGFWNVAKHFIWPVVILGVFVGGWLLVPEYGRGAGLSGACPSVPTLNPQPPLPKGIVPVPLILEQAEGVTVNLWRDRAIRNKTAFLQASKAQPTKSNTEFAALTKTTTFHVAKRPLERRELDGNIGPVQYVAVAQVTGQKEVSLTVCIDPSGFDADPGTYVGSVRISGRPIQPLTVPVTVTLQYPSYRWIVPLIGGLTLIAGSFTVWAAGKKAQQSGKPPRSVWKDIDQLSGWIADNYVGVVGGSITAISVFLAKYWRNPAWGANAPEDWFALLGSMFTAYTATLTAATALVSPSAPEPAAQDQGLDQDEGVPQGG
jgi:hypothetical protein